jgi:hypothetical protein
MARAYYLDVQNKIMDTSRSALLSVIKRVT